MACNCGSNSQPMVMTAEERSLSVANSCLDNASFIQGSNSIKLVSGVSDCNLSWSIPAIPTIEIPMNENVMTTNIKGDRTVVIRLIAVDGQVTTKSVKITIR